MVVGKNKVGVDQGGQLQLYYIGAKEGVFRADTKAHPMEKSLTVSEGEYVWELLRLYYIELREGSTERIPLLAARISSSGKTVVVGYNYAFVAAAMGRACRGLCIEAATSFSAV